MDVFVGAVGHSHDFSVFEQSPLSVKLSDPSSDLYRLFEDASIDVAGVHVPLLLLGDSAYPVRPFLLPAFKESLAAGRSALILIESTAIHAML